MTPQTLLLVTCHPPCQLDSLCMGLGTIRLHGCLLMLRLPACRLRDVPCGTPTPSPSLSAPSARCNPHAAPLGSGGRRRTGSQRPPPPCCRRQAGGRGAQQQAAAAPLHASLPPASNVGSPTASRPALGAPQPLLPPTLATALLPAPRTALGLPSTPPRGRGGACQGTTGARWGWAALGCLLPSPAFRRQCVVDSPI